MDPNSLRTLLQIVIVSGVILNIYALGRIREFSITDYDRIGANRDVQKGVHILGIFLPGVGVISGLYWMAITRPKLEALRKESSRSGKVPAPTTLNTPKSTSGRSTDGERIASSNSVHNSKESTGLPADMVLLAKLHEKGILSDKEFFKAKSQLLALSGSLETANSTEFLVSSTRPSNLQHAHESRTSTSRPQIDDEYEELLFLKSKMKTRVSVKSVNDAVANSRRDSTFSPSVLVAVVMAQRLDSRHASESLPLHDAIKYFSAGAEIGTLLFSERPATVDLLHEVKFREFKDFVNGAIEDADYFCDMQSSVVDAFVDQLPPAVINWLKMNSTQQSKRNRDSQAIRKFFVSGLSYVGFLSSKNK